ncbi:MAG: hypothetical protein Q4F81_05395 [Eubacteriales bacterium]|nr:hypothetical protein [Eubacteriales bacterium]
MTRNHKVTGRALSMPAGFAIGTGISLGTMLLLSALLAKLISTERLEWDKIGYGIMVILLVTSALGAKFTCMMVKRRKLMSCMVAGLLYWLCLLMITALFFGGQYNGVGITGAVILCGSAVICLQELKGERGRNAGQHRGKLKKRRL